MPPDCQSHHPLLHLALTLLLPFFFFLFFICFLFYVLLLQSFPPFIFPPKPTSKWYIDLTAKVTPRWDRLKILKSLYILVIIVKAYIYISWYWNISSTWPNRNNNWYNIDYHGFAPWLCSSVSFLCHCRSPPHYCQLSLSTVTLLVSCVSMTHSISISLFSILSSFKVIMTFIFLGTQSQSPLLSFSIPRSNSNFYWCQVAVNNDMGINLQIWGLVSLVCTLMGFV